MRKVALQDDCVYSICDEQPTVGVNIAFASTQSLAEGVARPSLLAARCAEWEAFKTRGWHCLDLQEDLAAVTTLSDVIVDFPQARDESLLRAYLMNKLLAGPLQIVSCE